MQKLWRRPPSLLRSVDVFLFRCSFNDVRSRSSIPYICYVMTDHVFNTVFSHIHTYIYITRVCAPVLAAGLVWFGGFRYLVLVISPKHYHNEMENWGDFIIEVLFCIALYSATDTPSEQTIHHWFWFVDRRR